MPAAINLKWVIFLFQVRITFSFFLLDNFFLMFILQFENCIINSRSSFCNCELDPAKISNIFKNTLRSINEQKGENKVEFLI